MKGHTEPVHHYHTRKRIHDSLEKYPHPGKWKRFLDKSIYAIGLFGPIVTLDQVKTIWINHNASGVSIISWSGYLFAGIFWMAYGISHKEKPIIVTYSAWIVLYILIISGTIIYR